MKKIPFLLLILISLLAIFLRFWHLDQIPNELFGDEVDVGYQAFSLLQTGKDYMGQPWPVYIHSLSEWRAPLFIYSVIPGIGFLGLNEWGIRIPAAFFGLLDIIFLFLLIEEVFRDRKLAILASLFLAFSPWHLQYSRAGFEVTLLLFLLLAGATFFLKGCKKRLYFVPAALFWGLAPYAYSTATLFLPLFVLLILVSFRKDFLKLKFNSHILTFFVLLFIILAPLGKEVLSGRAGERFQYLSIFKDANLVEEINQARLDTLTSDSPQVGLIERFFHNRVLGWSKAISNNYVRSLSPEFLFLSGDANGRHSIGRRGELYWVYLVLVGLGLILMVRGKISNPGKVFTVGWLLLAPLASSLTVDGGTHATRLILMLPPLMIVAGWGGQAFFDWKNKVRVALGMTLTALFVLEVVIYAHQYFVHYPKDSLRWWPDGLKEGMTYIKDHSKGYEKVVVNDTYNHSLLYFLFWTAYPPAQFQSEFTGDTFQKEILPGVDGFKLNKYYFGSLSENTKRTMGFVKVISPGMLYFISQKDEVGGSWDWRTDHPNEINVLKAITNHREEVIYYLVTAKPAP